MQGQNPRPTKGGLDGAPGECKVKIPAQPEEGWTGHPENYRLMAICHNSVWESASQPAMDAIRLAGCATGYNMFAKAVQEGRA